MSQSFKKQLLSKTQSSVCEEIEIIQSLWSNYGKISRYELDRSFEKTVVVKFISPPDIFNHPRGWNTSNSHNRKIKSYQVETYWYEKWSQNCNPNCRIPKFIGSFSEGAKHWIIMEDLNLNFPLRKQEIDLSEVKNCLKWLANFHAIFLEKSASGLWDIGTYWHLETRPDEFEKIANQKLKSKAHLIDRLLNECKYKTIVHGDAKLANFCFSEDGKNVAAVDFQYVGGGCGIKDVAYFLGSCLSSSECELLETELLDFYFLELEKALEESQSKIQFKELEDEWRLLYPIAWTDFTRFLMGWMPEHQKVNGYSLRLMDKVLRSL